jgi:hypothetical protein
MLHSFYGSYARAIMANWKADLESRLEVFLVEFEQTSSMLGQYQESNV